MRCMYLIKLYKNNVSQLHTFTVKLRFDITVEGFKVKTTKILPLRLGLGGRPLGLGRRPLGLGGRPLGLGRRPLGLGRRPLGLGGRPLGLGRRPLGLGGRPLGFGRRRGSFSSSAFDPKSSVKKLSFDYFSAKRVINLSNF